MGKKDLKNSAKVSFFFLFWALLSQKYVKEGIVP